MTGTRADNRIEFWYEFASTYSYIAVNRVADLAKNEGLIFDWKPFLLGPIFKAQGWDTSPFNIYKAKGDYMWRDVERLCDKFDIPFLRPTVFPRNSVLATRVAYLSTKEEAGREDWCWEFSLRVFRANFAEDKDISDKEEIRAILENPVFDNKGNPAEKILELATEPENRTAFREHNIHAQNIRIFGAPTFIVNGEVFWGNDRLEDAIEWCLRR